VRTVICVVIVMDRITKQYLGTVALRRVVANCWLRVSVANCDLYDCCDEQDCLVFFFSDGF